MQTMRALLTSAMSRCMLFLGNVVMFMGFQAVVLQMIVSVC